jgi:predicted PurR-regulated permease PerM
MIIIGVVTWVGATAIGLPGAFPLAVIAGVMELIPNLGPFLAAIPAVIVALIQGSTYLAVNNLIFALIVIGLYFLIQQLENTFIVPRILGEAVDLHPFVVLIGVVIGANVAGILGALLAAPVIASGREIISYLYAKILGQDPFPPEDEKSEVVTVSWQEQGRQLITRGQQLVSKVKDALQEQKKEDVPVIPPPEAEPSNPDETPQEEAAL